MSCGNSKSAAESIRKRGRLAALLPVSLLAAGCQDYHGLVLNHESRRPVANAVISHAGKAVRTNARGEFTLNRLNPGQPLGVKAPGFRPKQLNPAGQGNFKIELDPFEARGLYLSYTALGSPEVRERAMRLLDGERLNTLVLDVKDSQGRMTFFNSAPSAGQIGAFGGVKFDDLGAFIQDLHRRKIYVVGRMAVFKDGLLAKHNPSWAARSVGQPSNLWLDPFRREVNVYNLAVAKAAAAAGFDEIQFDYLRFPTTVELPSAKYSRADTGENRAEAIESFINQAAQALAQSNVCLSLRLESGGLWDQGRGGQRTTFIPGAVDYLAANVRKPAELRGLGMVLLAQPKRFRAYLEWQGQDPKGSSNRLQNLRLLVETGRFAGSSGWILCDPRDQLDCSLESIRTLAPTEE